MRDGGWVEVRPGRAPGKAAAEYSGACIGTGLCLLLYSGALIAWVIRGVVQEGITFADFVECLFNPATTAPSRLLGQYEWAFAAGCLTVATLALAQRQVARSAALLLGFLLLALSLREAVALFDTAYREQYSSDYLGGWTLATRGLGLLVALAVPAVMLPARDRDARPGDETTCRPRVVCGVLFLIMGAVQAAWTVHGLTAAPADVGAFLRGVVDASPTGTSQLAATGEFYTVASPLTLGVVGLLACRGRHEVRGALVAFAAIELYLTVRSLVLLAVTGYFSHSLNGTEGTLNMVTTAFGLTAMTSVLVLTSRPGRPFGLPYGGESPRSSSSRPATGG